MKLFNFLLSLVGTIFACIPVILEVFYNEDITNDGLISSRVVVFGLFNITYMTLALYSLLKPEGDSFHILLGIMSLILGLIFGIIMCFISVDMGHELAPLLTYTISIICICSIFMNITCSKRDKSHKYWAVRLYVIISSYSIYLMIQHAAALVDTANYLVSWLFWIVPMFVSEVILQCYAREERNSVSRITFM